VANFGNRVYELRTQAGLTQPELAVALSAVCESVITRSAVSMWETGNRTPKFEVMEAIADYFNVNMDYLLGREDQKTADLSQVSSQDLRLLAWFRSLPVEKQKAILVSQDAPKGLV